MAGSRWTRGFQPPLPQFKTVLRPHEACCYVIPALVTTCVFTYFCFRNPSVHRFAILPCVFIFFNFYFLFVFNVYLFLRQRETERELGRGREKGRHRIWNKLQALSCQHKAWVSTKPDVGLKLTNCKIMTWAEVGCLTDWATQVPLWWEYLANSSM